MSTAAQDGYPISTDRPSFSDGTQIIPLGRWQLESGYTFSRVQGTDAQTLGELLLRFPLNRETELRISNVSFAIVSDGAGMRNEGPTDAVLGIKNRIKTGVAGKSPDLALIVQSTVPTGASDFTVDRNQPAIKLAWFFQADGDDGFGGNVVWSSLGSGEAEFDQWGLGIYWAKTLSQRTGLFLEAYKLLPSTKDGPDALFFDAGITHTLNPATQIDFRIGSGINQSRDGWFVGFGVAYRF